MNDYNLWLKEINFTEEQLQDWMKYQDKYYFIEIESNIYYKSNSKIQGQGLFASNNISKGDVIGEGTIKDKRTTLTRYINHSSNPNVYFEKVKDKVIVFAMQNIKKDNELTTNYRHEKLS